MFLNTFKFLKFKLACNNVSTARERYEPVVLRLVFLGMSPLRFVNVSSRIITLGRKTSSKIKTLRITQTCSMAYKINAVFNPNPI